MIYVLLVVHLLWLPIIHIVHVLQIMSKKVINLSVYVLILFLKSIKHVFVQMVLLYIIILVYLVMLQIVFNVMKQIFVANV
jgi:hypothetical protein